MKVSLIDYGVARPFIEHWHYSNNVPKGHNLFFGCFLTDTLYAVANYGDGVNPYQAKFLKNETGKDVTIQNLVELKRLCRREPKEDVYLTQFLSRCHKQLKEIGYRFVVSFSDPAYGHSGGVYKAANFQHLGKTNAEWHIVDVDGQPVHRRVAYRYAKRHGILIEDARKTLGYTRQRTCPKDRWFISL